MNKIGIGYIGFSIKILEDIYYSDLFDIKVIVTEKSRVTSEIILFSELRETRIFIVENISDFERKIDQIIEYTTLFVMYRCGLIITDTILNKSRVFNIHPGSLKRNRGPFPIERALLNNEDYTEVSLYEINEKIDLGLIIKTVMIPVNICDNNLTLMNNAEKNLSLLLALLYEFLNGKGEGVTILKGTYYGRVIEDDYTIDVYHDSISETYNKIRSQHSYKGAVIWYRDTKYYIDKLIKIQVSSMEQESVIDLVEDNIFVIHKGDYNIYLNIRK